MHYIEECGECCATPDNFSTPMNTLGMGDVDPINSEPLPQAKNPNKKRKMKSLKKYIQDKNDNTNSKN